MKISSFSVIIIFILFSVIGIILLPLLSVQLLPAHGSSMIYISVNYDGKTLEDSEKKITRPIESTLVRIAGINEISSKTSINEAQISIKLDKWKDPEEFRFEAIQELRSLYERLPSNTTFPKIEFTDPKENTNNTPFLTYYIYGTKNIEKTLYQIREILNQVSGLSRYEILEMGKDEIIIDVNPDKLSYYQITFSELYEILKENFQQTNLGKHQTTDGLSFIIFENNLNYEDLKNLEIPRLNKKPILLSELGNLILQPRSPNSSTRVNGIEFTTLNCYANKEANTLTLASEIKNGIASLNLEDTNISLEYDATKELKQELEKIVFRTFLTLGILFIFLVALTNHSKYIFIVIVSLLVNILISIIIYYIFDISIHLYTLVGISIALGLLIDNVIIIIEDIKITGKNKIFFAILASTFTAVGSLMVIFLLGEEHKIYLLDFSIAIIINLLVSLPIAYYFVPAILTKFPVLIKKKYLTKARYLKLQKLSTIYKNLILRLLKVKWLIIILSVWAFGIPLFLLPNQIKSNENFFIEKYNEILSNDNFKNHLQPKINKWLGGSLYLFINNYTSKKTEPKKIRTQLKIIISLSEGANFTLINSIAKELENELNKDKNIIEKYYTKIYNSSLAHIDIFFNEPHHISLPPKYKHHLEKKILELGAPNIIVEGVGQAFGSIENSNSENNSFTIKGYNYSKLKNYAYQIRESILKYGRIKEVSIKNTNSFWDNSNHEHFLKLQGDELIQYKDISTYFKNISDKELHLGKIRYANNTFSEIYLQKMSSNELTIWDLKNKPLINEDNSIIKLSEIESIEKIKTSNSIYKRNQEYILYVNYKFIGSPEHANEFKNEFIKEFKPNFSLGFDFIEEDNITLQDKSTNYLYFIILIILIIYIISAILLESVVLPLIVILNIPFSYIGVFLSFYFFDLKLDEGAYASLLMLSGMVTNAALYIISDFRRTVKNTKSINQYIRAFNHKIISITITNGAAILSLLPFIIIGEDNGFWYSMSIGIIGGLLFSMIGVLVLIPLLLPINSK